MSDPNRLAGTASVTIDGRAYNITGEGSYRPSTATRTTLMGLDGYHGYSETPMPGKIEWKGRDSGSLSLKALNEAVNASVVLVLANNKIVIGRNMARVGDPVEASTDDASFTVTFEGPDVTETTA